MNSINIIANMTGYSNKENKQMPKKTYVKRTDEEKKARKDELTEEIANFFISSIKNNTAPWMNPCKASEFIYPCNPSTKHTYTGSNSLYLETIQREKYKSNDPRWYTFNNIRELSEKNSDIKLKEGSKGSPIVFFDRVPVDEKRKIIPYKDRETIKPSGYIPMTKQFFVFHASCIENLPPYEKLKEIENKQFNNIDNIENYIKNTKAEITFDAKDLNFYSRTTDSIHLVEKKFFVSENDYYSTVLHELAHWTGHEKRLNRESLTNYKNNRPLEEITAEIGSYMLCKSLNMDFNPQNNISYIQSWANENKKDANIILLASKQAENIKTFCDKLQNNNTKIKTEVNINKNTTTHKSR